MHVHHLSVLNVFIFIARFDTSASDSINAWDGGDPSARLLRGNLEAVDHDEERTSLASMLAIERQSGTVRALDAFNEMGLKNAGTALLNHPHFPQWIQRVEQIKNQYPNEETSALSALSYHHNDATLAKIFDVKDPTKLPEYAVDLHLEYLATKQVRPEKVFHLFQLEKDANLLGNRYFTIWHKYVDMFNAKHHEDAQPMLTTLIQLIAHAKDVDETKDIANHVEKELVQHVVGFTNPEKVFEKMGCDSAEKLFEVPFLSFWWKCMDAYYAKNPNIRNQDQVQWLIKRFGANDLSRFILEAKANKRLASIAEELESQQIKRWRNNKISIYDLYEELGLDKAHDDFSKTPLLDTWVSHMDFCVSNRLDSLQELIINLEAHFKPRPFLQILDVAKKFPSLREIATDITICKHASTPKKAFIQIGLAPEKPDLRRPHLEGHEAGVKLAGFDPTKENLLENPHFKNWLLYADIYKKTHPPFEWFRVFGEFYSPKAIAQMIVHVSKKPDTSLMATNVWDKLTVYLAQKFRSPDLVFEYFEPLKEGEIELITTKVKKWLEYRTMFNNAFKDQGFYEGKKVGMDKLDELIETLKLDDKNAKVVSKLEALSEKTKKKEAEAVADKVALHKQPRSPLVLNFKESA